ncbi:DUF4350 domain-containing protein [Patulibacter minatonensis]|uniref:DUF4350 domain-containing protein n=1 Tax=Patulibacter minatonensis TaxID=298163 RepID=UPI00047E113A|nr:DUF4350 domain-containing protein [Patulibacter minatonensis]
MKGKVIAGVLAAVVVLVVLATQFSGGDDGSTEVRDGWRSGAERGLGAWAAVLRHEGVRLRVRDVDPSSMRLLPGTTYVFAEELLDDDAADRVVEELRRGARVVAVGDDADLVLRALDEPTADETRTSGDAVAVRDAAETRATDLVRRSGVVWSDPPSDLRPLLELDRPGGDAVAGTLRVGRGTVVLIPDRGIVENLDLREADNAAFAAAVVGRGKAVALRTRESGSVGGLPSRAVLVVLLLVAAAAVALVARGRRLGPAVQPDEDPTPGRSGYVDAVAAVLARTSDRRSAVERLRARGRALLARRIGLEPDPTPEDVRAAARSAGLTDADAAALAGGPGAAPPGTDELQAVGRALARLEGDTR